MPGNDAICLTPFDTPEHVIKVRSPRRLGALCFNIDIYNGYVFPGGDKAFDLSSLRFEGKDLPILGFGRFSAVEEIAHNEGVERGDSGAVEVLLEFISSEYNRSS